MAEKFVTVTLPEEAFQLARKSKNVSLPAGTVAKILATRIDVSLGSDRLCRHLMLTVAEAQGLHEYFRRCADAFTPRSATAATR
jgi:hypothetical protein